MNNFTDLLSIGIGGGGFAVLRQACGAVEYIDFRETAPLLSNSTMYNNNYNASLVGDLAVAVPGEIKGYEFMHKNHSKLAWKDLFDPSIKLADSGFAAGVELVKTLNTEKDWILKNEEFMKVFGKNGTLVKVNDIVYRKNLASTLKKISEQGSKGFYEGIVAQDIGDYVKQTGGILSLKDLKNYKPIVREPSTGKFLNSTLISTKAPSSGSIVFGVLGLLDYVIRAHELEYQVDIYHRFVEYLKFGYASRTRLGDPAFNLTITPFQVQITSKQYIEKLRHRVDLKHTHNYIYYDPYYAPKELPGTTHLSVVDKEGFAISLTTTVNMDFGAQLMIPKSGIILNNEMNDFSIPDNSNGFNLAPSILNYIQPNKRPLSYTVPTIVVKDNGEAIALGGAGGSLITSSVAQVLVEIYLNKKNTMEAVNSSRIHNQLLPQVTNVEEGFNQSIIDGLKSMIHNITKRSNLSEVQIVTRSRNGSIEAYSDFRKYSFAEAY